MSDSRTKDSILKDMNEIMPFEDIAPEQLPYIREAMDIYADQKSNTPQKALELNKQLKPEAIFEWCNNLEKRIEKLEDKPDIPGIIWDPTDNDDEWHSIKWKEVVNKNKCIYEIVDYTDPERYYPLGIYDSYEEAIGVIRDKEYKSKPISEWAVEAETIKVLERKKGWSGNGDPVMEVERMEVRNDKEDTCEWKTVKIKYL